MKHTIVLSAIALLCCAGCFRQDHRTIDVAVPQLASEACFQAISDGLKGVDGIEGLRPDYANRRLAVTYNALKLGIKNIEAVIASAGFDANDTTAPADIRARLPEGCR